MTDFMKGERNRVVVHYKDGKVLKGYTHDFTPMKDILHLITKQEKGKEDIHEIRTADLKAIFFVRTLEGNRDYNEKKRFDEIANPLLRGMQIRVEFFDGEVMSGVTQGYSKARKGFFLVPIDPQSNNERIYVIADALRDVKLGSAAEEEETITVICSTCEARYTISSRKIPLGKKVVATCKRCGHNFEIKPSAPKGQH